MVCGSLITAAITLVNVLVLVVFMAVLYLGFTAIWAVDRLYLVHKRIFTACHECKKKSLIPTYLCPRCGAKHTNFDPWRIWDSAAHMQLWGKAPHHLF